MPSQTEEIITRYIADDRYSATVMKATRHTKQFGSAVDHVQSKTAKSGGMAGLLDDVDHAASKFGNLANVFSNFSGLIDIALVPWKLFGEALVAAGTAKITAGIAFAGVAKQALDAYSDIDSLRRGLIAVAGSAEMASAEFDRLREVAKLPGLGLKEAVEGSVRLQSAGLSFAAAEKAMLAFGNALATVGKGKDDLNEVINQLSQIQSSGKLQGDELRVIAERVPQVRKAMKDAFGTTSAEEIAKSGRTIEDVIDGITTQLMKLPKVTGGVKNSLENFSDAATIAMSTAGEAIAKQYMPALDKLSTMIENMANSGAFASIANEWSRIFGGGNADFFVTAASYVFAVAQALPTFIDAAVQTAKEMIVWIYDRVKMMAQIVGAVTGSGNLIKAQIEAIEDLVNSELSPSSAFGMTIKQIEDAAQRFRDMANAPKDAGAAVADAINNSQANSPLIKIEKNTRATADTLQRQEQIYQKMLGGGGRTPIDATTIGSFRRGSKGSQLQQAINNLVAAVHREGQNAVMTNLLTQARR